MMAKRKLARAKALAPRTVISQAATASNASPPEVVLLAVTGKSPAILTETVWALAHQDEPLIPSRVIALTTSAGRGEIAGCLLQPSERLGGISAWDALRAALQAEGLDLSGRLRFGQTADDIRVITAHDRGTGRSRELPDIRTPQDNEAAADFLLEQVRAIVENPDTQLIASIAGGRKTMGALLYACMTLAARETDRLTHVLVNEPFELLRDFYFPAQPGGALAGRDGKSYDPAAACIELAEVPFVPLRNLFVRELGRKAGTFSRLVESCRENIRRRAGEQVRLTVNLKRPEIDINGSRLRLSPREQTVLLFLARRAKESRPPFASLKTALDALNEFRGELHHTAPQNDPADWRHTVNRPFEDDLDIRRALSSLREKVRSLGGDAALLAACLPEKGRFSLDVPGPMIFLP